ncbi:MAG: hypothetical protein FJ267_03120 [Planctomycetes bacterium]|nr:hypothetical protein [Planctomycetota bacterium]
MKCLVAIGITGLVLSYSEARRIQAAVVKTKISLVGYGRYQHAKGSVSYVSKIGEADTPDEQKLTIRVENVPLGAGRELFVYVHEKVIGTIKLDQKRNGELTIETKYGKFAPSVNASSFVAVKLSDGSCVLW